MIQRCSQPFCHRTGHYLAGRIRIRHDTPRLVVGHCRLCFDDGRALVCSRCAWWKQAANAGAGVYELACRRHGLLLGIEEDTVFADDVPQEPAASPEVTAIPDTAWVELFQSAVERGDVRSRQVLRIHGSGADALDAWTREAGRASALGWVGGEGRCLYELGRTWFETDRSRAEACLDAAAPLLRRAGSASLFTCLFLKIACLRERTVDAAAQLPHLTAVIDAGDALGPATLLVDQLRAVRLDLRLRAGDIGGAVLDAAALPDADKRLREMSDALYAAHGEDWPRRNQPEFCRDIPDWGEPARFPPSSHSWRPAALLELMNVAAVLFDAGLTAEARRVHEHALTRLEEALRHPQWLMNHYARELQIRGEHRAAAAVFIRTLRRDGMRGHRLCATLYGNLGISLGALRRWREAERVLRQATALDPAFPSPHFWLARLYFLRDAAGDRERLRDASHAYHALTESSSVDRSARRTIVAQWVGQKST